MKKIFFILVALIAMTVASKAQKEVTMFMDVPVDGDSADVALALKGKGYSRKALVCDNNYKVDVVSTPKGVCQIRLTEYKGTKNVQKAVEKYNKLVQWFQKKERYAEYEKNMLIKTEDDDAEHIKNIKDRWYYAEFFQTTTGEEENYDKVVSFFLIEDKGNYRLVICFENRNNYSDNSIVM